MTHHAVLSAIGCTWTVLGLIWILGVAFTKRTVRRQPLGSRIFHLVFAGAGFALLGSDWFERSWLATRILPQSSAFEIAGLVLTIAGCAFAAWARITLGGNWSSQATVKANHELVVTGPYALMRHPIYTGLATAALGTAFAIAEVRCILGMVVIVLALFVKISHEEKFMMQTFPEGYPRYRRRVKALIPGLL